MSELDLLVQATQIIFDKTIPFNEQKALALDHITLGTCSKNIQIIQYSNKIWADLQADPEFWTHTDQVVQYSKMSQTKFLTLKILEEQVKTKWALVDLDSRSALKSFILQQMLLYGKKNQHDLIEESLLNQINIIIIQILKHEWKSTWNQFIPEICEMSKQDQSLCENSLKILKLLSQEIFDYSKHQMTTEQIVELKNTLHTQFGIIYQLCFYLLTTHLENQNQLKQSLIKQTLDTLYTYLSWIPFGYIFMTDLIEVLVQIFEIAHFRNLAIRCLTEIVILPLDQENTNIQKQKIGIIMEKLLIRLKQIFPCDFGFVNERQRLRSTSNTQLQFFDDFCVILTHLFTGILQTHLVWLEDMAQNNQTAQALIELSLQYLISFTALPLEQNYKTCIEFWFEFTTKLIEQPKHKQQMSQQIVLNIYQEQQATLSNSVYPKVLLELRRIVVGKMAKPQEVLICIDENGIPYKEELQNTENNAMYELLRDLLINLGKLNWVSTREIITQKLDKQVCQFILKISLFYYIDILRIKNGVNYLMSDIYK